MKLLFIMKGLNEDFFLLLLLSHGDAENSSQSQRQSYSCPFDCSHMYAHTILPFLFSFISYSRLSFSVFHFFFFFLACLLIPFRHFYNIIAIAFPSSSSSFHICKPKDFTTATTAAAAVETIVWEKKKVSRRYHVLQQQRRHHLMEDFFLTKKK